MLVSKSFYFSGGGYLRTLQGLHRALSLEPSVQLLLGREGTGKSALCAKLAQFLLRKQQRVLHLASGVESADLLGIALARELDLPAQGSPAALLEEAVHAGKQALILIIDDAHLLTEVVLLELERMAQVTVQGRRACSLLLSGEPALSGRLLGKPALSTLADAARRPFVLEPMSTTELEVFLQTFAAESGAGDLGFSEDAMHLLFQLCRGYPAPAAKLAAEVVASVSGNPHAGPLTRQDLDQVVKNSVDERLLPSSRLAAQSSRPGLLPLAAVVIIASLAFVYRQLDEQASETAIATASAPAVESSPFAEPDSEPPQAAQLNPAGADAQPVANVATATTTAFVASPGASQTETGNEAAYETGNETERTAQAQPVPASPDRRTVELDDDRARLLAAMEQVRRAAEAAAQAATDSDLVLVTAAERGISEDQFALPRYEDLLSDPGQPAGSTDEPERAITPAEPPAAERAVSAAQAADNETLPQVADAADASAPPDSSAGQDRQLATTAVAVPDSVPGQQPGADADSDAEFRAAVQAWIQAWQAQDLDAYFDHYHSRYQPRYQDSVAEWRSNRQRVIGNAAWIALALSDFQVVERDADSVEVQFWLGYQSGSYQDRTLKKLVLAREDNRWRILEEVNLEVQA